MQGVFDHRIKTWQKWQDSQLLLQRKREAEAKLQFTNKPDKLQQAKDEIKEVRHAPLCTDSHIRAPLESGFEKLTGKESSLCKNLIFPLLSSDASIKKKKNQFGQ